MVVLEKEIEFKDQLSHLIGEEVCFIKKINRGLNSRVFIVGTRGDKTYVAKMYNQCSMDLRNRLNVEFSSLSFLWDEGFRNIIRPVVKDEKQFFAIYDFIEGREISQESVTKNEMDQAIDFLVRLKILSEDEKSEIFEFASEACFSLKEIIDNINFRLRRLIKLNRSDYIYSELRIFLERDFIPLFKEIKRWLQDNISNQNLSFNEKLAKRLRTLSPSDFGFHNAIQDLNGKIIFLDFEYFGWDDPAKAISDFILHPAMSLSGDQKKYFVNRIIEKFDSDEQLLTRLRNVFPLFALKWCMIFLNEFIPHERERRNFAMEENNEGYEQILKGQLSKAKKMLNQIKNSYRTFNYA